VAATRVDLGSALAGGQVGEALVVEDLEHASRTSSITSRNVQLASSGQEQGS
jgi:hypothetical protein